MSDQQQHQSAPWYQGHEGVDAELMGHFQNRGMDKMTPQAAAIAAAKAHREAEKLIGVPADQIVKLPKDPNDAAWAGVWERLGAPKDAKDYDFSTIKKANGEAADPKLADALRESAAALRLPKDQTTRIAADVVKYLDSVDAAKTAEYSALIETQKATLKTSWGTNYDANMVVAKNAAIALGVTADMINALEKTAGYDKVMEMFRNVGSKIGEDKFIQNSGQGGPGVMTREGAMARKAELMADKAWAARYLDGGAAEKREMTALNTLIVGGDDTEDMRRRGY